jgi:hypothetical protein
MAKIYNYSTRIGADNCHLTERDLQNGVYAQYTAAAPSTCSSQQSLDFATAEHQPVPKGGYGFTAAGGRGIDADSSLRIAPGTQEKQRLNLLQRPFATVPYLGRGKHSPDVETHLRIGLPTNQRQLDDSATERPYQQQQPLVPSLAATITNPANLVEGVAADGWVRGGVPTRQMAKATTNSIN